MIREEFRLLNSELKIENAPRSCLRFADDDQTHTRRMHHAHSQFERNGEKETSEREYAPTYIVSLRDVFFFFSNPEDEVVFPLFSPSAMNFSSLTSRVFAVFLFFFSSTSSSLSSSPSLDLDDGDDVVIF